MLGWRGWRERTRVAVVGVGLDVPFGNLDVILTDDLVEGKGTTAELLAGVAVAVD